MSCVEMQDKITEVGRSNQSDVVCRVVKANETAIIDVSSLQDEPHSKLGVDNTNVRNGLYVPLRTDSGQVCLFLTYFTGSERVHFDSAGGGFISAGGGFVVFFSFLLVVLATAAFYQRES